MFRVRMVLGGLVLCAAPVFAQVGGGGGAGVQVVPDFEDAIVFSVGVGIAYGIDSLDFLDADGNPGQDGYPDIAVAGMGRSLDVDCALGRRQQEPESVP